VELKTRDLMAQSENDRPVNCHYVPRNRAQKKSKGAGRLLELKKKMKTHKLNAETASGDSVAKY
jgi:hypothetical protein